MKTLMLLFFIIFYGSLELFTQDNQFAEISTPYFGQKPPGMIPVVFAPEIISSKDYDEWGLAVNENWTEIFFSRAEHNKASIYCVRLVSNSWTKPEIADFSGKYNDSHPAFSADCSRLYFGSKRPYRKAKEGFNLWYSEKNGSKWSLPNIMKAPLINQTVHAVSIAANGNIYASGIVIFKKTDTGYLPASKLSTDIIGTHPAVSADESYIVFSSRKQDGYGGTDLYVSFRNDYNNWSEPINLGEKLNTEYVESSPTISADGKFLFFSRKGDIYWVSAKIIENIKLNQNR